MNQSRIRANNTFRLEIALEYNNLADRQRQRQAEGESELKKVRVCVLSVGGCHAVCRIIIAVRRIEVSECIAWSVTLDLFVLNALSLIWTATTYFNSIYYVATSK